MFNAAFQTLGLTWEYKVFPTPPDALKDTVERLREEGIRGFNVTVPYKQNVMALVDALQPEARAVGAVNTVTMTDEQTGRLEGTNTDVYGFYQSLIQHIDTEEKGHKRALILGAGGAARAVGSVLSRLNYQIYVAARDPDRGLALIRDIQTGLSSFGTLIPQVDSTHWRLQMMTIPWPSIAKIAARMTLIVNCTPVGMWPAVDSSPWPDDVPMPADALVYDLIYRPAQTQFMAQAAAAGAQTVGGLDMLLYQGAAAFRLWTGQEAPLNVMRNAARQALAL